MSFKRQIAKAFTKDGLKYFVSPFYNFVFDMKTGFFVRYGSKMGEDPTYSMFGPELLDIEISSGWCDGDCPWCYKGNCAEKEVRYMNIETYKKLFGKVNIPTLTQIAFGITSINSNPDFFDIMSFTRDNGIIPNYTTNGIGVTEDIAKRTAKLCGAVSVSVYPHTERFAFEAIERYKSAGMDQVNIHFMLSKETIEYSYAILDKMLRSGNKLAHAVVFLQYKDKNPDAKFHSPSFEEFKKLVDFSLEKEIPIGFDSCSSSMFLKATADRKNAKELAQCVDNCESSLFSFYIDDTGIGYPCSFLQGVGDWKDGINVLDCGDFVNDVWLSERVSEYRKKLINSSKKCKCELKDSCRSCFVYDINDCRRFCNENKNRIC